MVEFTRFLRQQIELDRRRLTGIQMAQIPADGATLGVPTSTVIGFHKIKSRRNDLADADVFGGRLAGIRYGQGIFGGPI